MSLRSATVHSVNTVYAQVIDRLGADTVIVWPSGWGCGAAAA